MTRHRATCRDCGSRATLPALFVDLCRPAYRLCAPCHHAAEEAAWHAYGPWGSPTQQAELTQKYGQPNKLKNAQSKT